MLRQTSHVPEKGGLSLRSSERARIQCQTALVWKELDTFSAWEARAGEMFLHPEITAHRICRLYEWICFRYHLGQEQRYIQS